MFSLPADLAERIEARVASGAYSSAEDVLYAAFDAVAMREEEEDLAAIRRGLAELEVGLGTPIGESNKAFRERNVLT